MRGFKAVSVALLLVMLLLAEFLFFSYFPLSITYAVSRDNPWGAFTAYLVFDGWANIIVVAFSCLMTLISTSLFWPQSRFLLPSSLLVLTNLTGIFAGLVWLLSPYSATVIVVIGPHGTNTYAKAGLGMSGAAFGALGFSVTLSILALVFQARNRLWNMTGMRASLWRFGMTGFGLLTFLGVILAVPAFLPNEAELVHSVGLLTGLVSALFVGRRTLGIEKDQLLVSSGPETLN